MALLIKRQGLLKTDGTEIVIQDNPNGGILIRFMPQGKFKGFAQTLFLMYWSSIQSDTNGFSNIDVLVDADTKLPVVIEKELTIEAIGQYEAIAQQALGEQPAYIITAFGYHLFIKEHLENILGADSVEIRLDLM